MALGEEPEEFFDLGEWLYTLGLADEPSEALGSAQFTVLDLADEIVRSRDDNGVAAGLRSARQEWTQRARPPGDGEFGSADSLGGPPEFTELREALDSSGFDLGWGVRDCGGQSFGEVYLHGPLRVQATVVDGEPLIQLSVWPIVGWRPIDVWRRWLDNTEPGLPIDLSEVASVGTRAAQRVFDRGFGPRWRRTDRVSWICSTRDCWTGVGPSTDGDYYEVNCHHIADWLSVDDYATRILSHQEVVDRNRLEPVGNLALLAHIDVNDLPLVLFTGSSYLVQRRLRKIVEPFAPDAQFVPIKVGERLFFEVKLPGSSQASVVDPVRSRAGHVDGAAYGRRVVDQRELGPPGHIVQATTKWLCDERFRRAVQAEGLDVTFEPTWLRSERAQTD